MSVFERLALIAVVTAASVAAASCGDGDKAPDASCSSGSCEPDASSEPEDAGSEPEEDARTATDAGQSSDAGLDAGDGMQAVTIRFKAKLGSEDLACGRVYQHQGKSDVKATPQDFRFYVQEVRLVQKGNQQEQRVLFDTKAPFQRPEVALLDFTDAAGQCGGNGGSIVNTTISGRVPAGDYDGIVFINGVPEDLNHAGPAETAKAPLDDVTLFWNWLGGYRFIVAELLPVDVVQDAGVHDAGADAGFADSGVPDAGASDAAVDASIDAGGDHVTVSEAAFVHIGSTGCSGSPGSGFTCTRQARNEIRLANFDPARNVVVADLAAVFKESDLASPLQCHGIDAPCTAPYAAFGIDMNTGKPAASQLVFHAE